jgi:GNAT superfamily N-acetyltransferase
MRFPLSPDLWQRLPRHPDWKYERVDGEAWLSSRPRPLLLRRSTSLAVPAVTLSGVQVCTFDARRDRSEVAKLLIDVWVDEEPYRSLEDPEATLQPQIQRSLAEDPDLGVIAIDAQGVCAAVLVPTTTGGTPTLAWLTVRRDAREQGLATALLGVVVETLSARGVDELASGASAGNIASLRWHLTHGFQLAPSPLREALRPTDAAHRQSG